MATDPNVIAQALQASNNAPSATQLALLLKNILDNTGDANIATAAAARAGDEWGGSAAALKGDQDALRQVLAGLVADTSTPLPNIDESSIANRADQRYSNLVGSVDRAQALTASQGYAKALRSGLTDSTAAQDQAQQLTRQYSDVYSKLRENAQSTAFQEALAQYKSMLDKRASQTQTMNSAVAGLANYGKTLLDNNRERSRIAQQTATTANKGMGDAWAKVLDSSVGKKVLGSIDGQVNEWLKSGAGPGVPPTAWGPSQTAPALPDSFKQFEAIPDQENGPMGPWTKGEFDNWHLPSSFDQYLAPQQPAPQVEQPQPEPAYQAPTDGGGDGGGEDDYWNW
jgi:hypothetical protein